VGGVTGKFQSLLNIACLKRKGERTRCSWNEIYKTDAVVIPAI